MPECCFIKGTQVELADGSPRNIEDLKPGDKVRGVSGSVNRVKSVLTPKLGGRQLWSFRGGEPWVTWEHPFLTVAGEWASINPDATRDEDWKDDIARLENQPLVHRDGATRITPLRAHDAEEQTVYNLELTGDHTYFANGYAVHNKGGDKSWHTMPDGTRWYGNDNQAWSQRQAVKQQMQQQQQAQTQTFNQAQELNNQTQLMLNQWQQGGLGGNMDLSGLPAGATWDPGTGSFVGPDGTPIEWNTLGGGGGATGQNPINAPYMPNPTGNIGGAGGDLEDAWQAGVAEAQQIYNLGQPQLDPNNYLDQVHQNLMSLMRPQANPHLDAMLKKGQRSVAEEALSSMGLSGRTATFDPVTGQVNDTALNMVNDIGDFTSDFLGSQYQQDMNRALQASLGGGDFISSSLQMMQNQPWKNLGNYANIFGQLTGSSPAMPDDPKTSGWDKLMGIGSLALGFAGLP